MITHASEDGLLPPGAPDVAPDVADLAHGHVVARGLDEDRHEVAVAGGGALELGDVAFHTGRVACGAHGLHTCHLARLAGGVDAMRLDRRVLGLDVAVDADDHALAPLDLRLVAEARLGDLALEEVLLDRCDDSAAPRDLL